MAEANDTPGKSKSDHRKAKGGDTVANGGVQGANPFDVRTIKELVALMSRHDLSEIDLREGEVRIRLRRGPRGPVAVTTPAASLSVIPSIVPAPPPVSEETKKPAKNLQTIKSPTPGTVYSAPNPGADPYVRPGSKVTPTTVVCIIEAMKVMNEITADCSGVITEVLVENQQAVEYGQVLFKVDPAG